MDKELEQLRKQIDGLDLRIVSLLGKRMEMVKQIGMLKKRKNLKSHDGKRWHQVLDRVIQTADKIGLPREMAENIYTVIHKFSIIIENKIILK